MKKFMNANVLAKVLLQIVIVVISGQSAVPRAMACSDGYDIGENQAISRVVEIEKTANCKYGYRVFFLVSKPSHWEMQCILPSHEHLNKSLSDLLGEAKLVKVRVRGYDNGDFFVLNTVSRTSDDLSLGPVLAVGETSPSGAE